MGFNGVYMGSSGIETTAGGIVVGIDWEYMNGNMTTVDMHTHT